MNTFFDTQTQGRLEDRINSLTPDAEARWGKMNAYQMLRHCTETTQVATGEKVHKRSVPGLLLGKVVLKSLTKNDKAFPRNQPTYPAFIIHDQGDFESQRESLLVSLKRLGQSSLETVQGITHPFFGKMTANQWRVLTHKHFDHHLNQFGV